MSRNVVGTAGAAGKLVVLKKLPLAALLASALACSFGHADDAAPNPALVSGIDRTSIDTSVRVQDDLFHYVNGNWLKQHPIPEDKSGWGLDYVMNENIQPQLRAIIEEAAKAPNRKPGTEAQQIGDLYASFMDEQKIEADGLKPLAPEFERIAALKDKQQLPELIAHYNEIGVTAPYDMGVHQDNRDSTKYVVDFVQSGLGLPDRDYYLKNDARLKEARTKYLAHIEKMLGLTGDKDARRKAKEILALETALAKVQWTQVQNRDPVKRYNKESLPDLGKLTPGYDWQPYMRTAGLDGKITYAIVSEPSYFKGWARILKKTPLATWKDYFTWHVLSSHAPYLNKAYVDENFAFYGTALNGVPQMRPRWKRGVSLTEGAIGEGLGKLYVEKYFPPENKARVEKLVANLLEAYRQSIATLDWMSPETKNAAQAKLALFTTKIGYPSRWRDYSAMKIDKDDLIGNVARANEFEYWRNVNKLGQPIDRDEWDMTPQTVNAYYNP
ncbi:MAG: M13 family peptidase, partial [Burkholderiaceae bacterium]|nr:M13 family peptidase [Burkholderiaceae bacterium]